MRKLIAILPLLVLLVAAGCGGGGGDNGPTVHEISILSDETVDGYVREEPVAPFARTSFLETATLFAGVDPRDTAEYRAFIDFPLDNIPADAVIESATLSFRVVGLALGDSGVPLQLDLVIFTPPLLPSYYSTLPALQSILVSPIRPADVGHRVVVDVTSLMREAQRRGFDDFQLRILEDLDAAFAGLIEIDNSTNDVAPQLDVVYH